MGWIAHLTPQEWFMMAGALATGSLSLWGVVYAARAAYRASRLNALEGRVGHLEEELDKLRKELQDERSARLRADHERNEAQSALSAMRVDLEGVRSHRDGLIQEARLFEGQVLELQRTVQDLKGEVDKRDRRILDLEREIERRKQADVRRHAS